MVEQVEKKSEEEVITPRRAGRIAKFKASGRSLGADGEVHLFTPGPPPCGCPDGGGMRLMAANLRDASKAEGTIIEFELDADSGTLAFTVDDMNRSCRMS